MTYFFLVTTYQRALLAAKDYESAKDIIISCGIEEEDIIDLYELEPDTYDVEGWLLAGDDDYLNDFLGISTSEYEYDYDRDGCDDECGCEYCSK